MKRFLFFVGIFWAFQLHAQLTVQGGFTAQQLAENLAGPGLVVTNATLTGALNSRGTFQSVNTGLGVGSGVFLTTGRILQAPGPASGADASTDNGRPGDASLTTLAGVQTYDAAVLQFDFVVTTDNIQFNFVFASEEYPEFVGAGYNDVFAFYISGPGIVGQENIALVPNTSIPVAIDNINSGSFWQYYVDNSSGSTVRFDAFTTRLRARKTGLIPCETYTLSLRIADAGDGVMDSGVFLEENSLVEGTVSATTNTASSGDTLALEGCIQASFTFNLDTVYPQPTSIPITVGGTATNGVDYAFIDSLVVIPAGQQSATIFLDAFSDGLSEGQETITLSYYPDPCSPPTTARLYIQDNTPIIFNTVGTNPTCAGSSNGQIQLNITGGTAPYSIVLNGVDTFSTSTITNLPAGLYGIEILDANGCGAEEQVVGGQFGGSPVFIPDGVNAPYTTTIPINGFPTGTLMTNVSMIQSVCIEMEHSFLGQLEIRLYAPNGQYVVLKEHPGGGVTNLGEPVANGPSDTNNPDTMMGDCYNYCFTANPTFGTMVSEAASFTYTYTDNRGMVLSDKYLPSGSYTPFQAFTPLLGTPMNGNWTVWVRDNSSQNNGWVCNWSISLKGDFTGDTVLLTAPPSPALSVVTTQAACGSSNGAINLSLTGGTGPFTYLWSNGITTQDLSNIPAGSYTVTVTGAGNCITSATFFVSNLTSPTVTGVATPVSCPGGNNGSIVLTTGGTGPFSYAWSNGATTQNLTNLNPGNYTVTVTGSGGCLNLSSYNVGTISALNPGISLQNETCGNENGSISLSMTGGTPPYQFAWSNGSTSSGIQQLTAGTYSVTVTDANLCSWTRSFTLLNVVGNCFVPCDLSLSGPVLTPENCGNGLGAIDLTVSSSFLPLTFQWSTGATTQDLNNLAAGTYLFTVTDANNCVIRDSFVVQNNTGGFMVSSVIPTSEYCGNGQGAIDLNIVGGIGPYHYQWSNGANTQDLSNLHQGTYAVTATDGNQCSLTTQVQILNNTGTMALTYGNAMPENCSNGLGSIDIAVSSPQGPLSYLWSNGATTEDLYPISAGTYTCTVTDNNGCQLSTPAYVVSNNSGTLSISDIDTYDETCGNGLGAINLDISGGSVPYSYTWSNGATTQNLSGLSAGPYTATVSDNNGCSLVAGPIQIRDLPGNLTANIVRVQDEICGNGRGHINLSVAGATLPVAYLWNTGNTSQDLLNLRAGSYQVTITDANGCSVIAGANVQNLAGSLDILNAIITSDSCSDNTGKIDLNVGNATMPISYSWSNGATTQDLNNVSAGTYSVTVSDGSGCQVSGSYSIPRFNSSLALGNTTLSNASCGLANGLVDIEITGSSGLVTYVWSNGIQVQDIRQTLPGTYQVTITDSSQCTLVAGPFVVGSGPGNLQVNVQTLVQPQCNASNGSIDLSVSGQAPFSFVWNDNATTEDRNNLPGGTYSVTITDGQGCSTTYSTSLAPTSGALSASVATITDAICGNASGGITLNVAGGTTYSYLWSNGSTNPALSGVPAGIYSVTVSSNGCQVILSSIRISNQPGTLNVTSLTHTDAICGGNNGSLDLTISGGVAPITYSWSNGATAQDIGNLPAGVYQCTITGSGGCSITAGTVIQNSPGTLSLISSSVTPAVCGSSNGSVTLQVVGGTAPLTYQWNNGATSSILSNLAAGIYNCLVRDSAGCTINPSVLVPDGGGAPVVAIASVSNAQCLWSVGAIDLEILGSSGPFVYQWNNGSQTQDLVNLPSGLYSVTVTDTNSCTNSTQIMVGVGSGTLIAHLDSIVQADCGNSNGSISLTTSGGSVPYSFSWSNNTTTEDIQNIPSGNYIVTVSDQNGCNFSSSYLVGNSSGAFAITGVQTTNETCGGSNGAINLTLNPGAGASTFIWSNGATTQNLSNLQQGTYFVTITDQIGCDIFGGPYTVQNLIGTLSASWQSSDELCSDGSGSIDLSVAGGLPPYSFVWSNNSNSEDLSGLSAGTFTVTITDSSNCSFQLPISVLNSQGTLNITSSTISPANCSFNSGAIDITVTLGTQPYVYNWSNGTTTEDLSGLASGIYLVTVSDAAGCEVTGTYSVGNNTTGLTFSSLSSGDENCGLGDGFIQGEAIGGNGDITYTLSNGAQNPFGSFYNLVAGTYTLTATDSLGCTVSQAFTIQNVGSLNIGPNTITDASCPTCADGAIDLTVNPPGVYNYSWSNGATTQDISGLLPGVYSVNLDNGANCFLYLEFTISYPNAFEAPLGWKLDVFPNPNNGHFQVNYAFTHNEPAIVEIFNLMGQKVWQVQIGNSQSGLLNIDLSDRPSGNYLLRVRTPDGMMSKPIALMP
jgi:subtilisin-like proprotein convertase family protein